MVDTGSEITSHSPTVLSAIMTVIVQKKLFIQISNREGTGYCDDPGVHQEGKGGRGDSTIQKASQSNYTSENLLTVYWREF